MLLLLCYNMKSIFSRIATKVGVPSGFRELEIVRRFRKTDKKEEKEEEKEEMEQGNEVGSNPSDEEDESQVVDILIKMKNHLKITRINSALQGEYQTLRHINRMLCSNPLKPEDIRLFLLTKSSEKVDYQGEEEEGPSNRSAINYYTLYSNGLIYQYYSVRALLWKVSVGYLPAKKNKWVSVMEGSLIHYHDCIREHILDVIAKKKKKTYSSETTLEIGNDNEGEKKAMDHPLNSLKESKWKTFFDDTELWRVIEKDTRRTKPNCNFFREEFEIEMDELKEYEIERSEVHLSKERRKTYYYDCLTRLIYIFLKTNPGVVYCQGMNQLAALILYSFANKNSEYFRRVGESDAFVCFQRVMQQLIQLPIPGFLNGQKYSQRFEELLKKIDLRLYEQLQATTLESLRILSIKWFSSLFLNEYGIDQTLILWDGLLATICKQANSTISFHNLVLSIGLALVHLNRSALSEGENPLLLFAKLPNSPEALLEKALNLYQIFRQFFR